MRRLIAIFFGLVGIMVLFQSFLISKSYSLEEFDANVTRTSVQRVSPDQAVFTQFLDGRSPDAGRDLLTISTTGPAQLIANTEPTDNALFLMYYFVAANGTVAAQETAKRLQDSRLLAKINVVHWKSNPGGVPSLFSIAPANSAAMISPKNGLRLFWVLGALCLIVAVYIWRGARSASE